jgi:hypothetical protein
MNSERYWKGSTYGKKPKAGSGGLIVLRFSDLELLRKRFASMPKELQIIESEIRRRQGKP